MKTQNNFGKYLVKFVYLGIFFLISNMGLAQAPAATDSLSRTVTVQYLGSENEMMVIGVSFINETGSSFNLSISNTDGDVLFRNRYTEKNFVQKFKVPKQEGKLNFEVGGTRSYHDFEAYNKVKPTEQLVVKKDN